MITGRDTVELNELLDRTSATLDRQGKAAKAERVPRDFREVADALERHRDTLELGDAFPSVLLDRFVEALRS